MIGHSPYAGGLGYRPAGGMSDAYFAKCAAEQAILAKALIKEWREENKARLRKYRSEVKQLDRWADDLNDGVVHKGLLPLATREKLEMDFADRAASANEVLKALAEDYRQKMVKAGVTTSLGYNFYDLRGPAFLIYPVNVPFRNSLPRWGKVNAGYGTAAHWKYTYLSPGTSYAGALEGERVATATPGETDALATYAELGIERAVTFTAEFAGEGYTDNVADEHLRGMHELFLQEESLMLFGNAGSGTGYNGFALGTANAPVCNSPVASVPAGAPNDGGTGFANGTTVSVRVVELTELGYPNNTQYGYQAAPTITSGLIPTYTRTNADATQNTINGGMGAVSAASNVVTATTGDPFVEAYVAAKKGAVAWVWYVDTTDASAPSAANAYITVITTTPYVYLGGAMPGSQAANATGLSTDHSAEALDFTGLFGWAAASGTWLNMSDITKTSPVTGSANNGKLNPGLAGVAAAPAVQEIEYDLLQQWNAFQTVSDALWCDAATKRLISAALFANTSGTPTYRFEITKDLQGNITGGFTVSGYKNLYSMKATGSEELPIRIHPMFPAGTMLYDKEVNPYPHSRIPGVRGMFVQRDYYSIEWPLVTRQWTFGTYCHETLGHYIPGLLTVRTGVQGVA